ncbi:SdpI family protein [Staphylococcus sp. IVB6181]|uniref:SdpI family protein n=1 Tax=Staphylococcus sp. IVB6181 TaxID=2929481 RepID=UPI0021D10B84|nr:SdpI family protein [Staphylococcus sp. IVB6181]UXV34960.1 SdpI family protein [Staphylococcus sp. IVB6181]
MLDTIKNNKMGLIIWVISLLTWVLSLAFLPNNIAMQYHDNGTISWSINKYLGALIFMAIISFIYIYYMILPVIDPKKANYRNFNTTYSLIISTILILVYFAEVLIILSNFGITFNSKLILNLVLALLFLIVGNYFQKIRTNWFIGFRTPWTLSSEKNWKKTHRLVGRIYILLGILCLIFPFMNIQTNWILLITIIIFAIIIPYIYSYLIYKQYQK